MKRFANLSIKLMFFVWLLAMVLPLRVSPALAQPGARLYFQPVKSTADTLVVDVMAENVTDLYGLELHLKYDPAILAAQDTKADQTGVQIEPGALLPVAQGFVVTNQANQSEGTITYALTLLNPAPAVSGSGSIARLTFKVLNNTPSTLSVDKAILVAINLQTIPVETVPFSVNPNAVLPGSSAASGTDDFPWWLVAAVILVLGILAMGGFVLLSRAFKPQAAARMVQEPGRRSLSSRPSVFKD